MSDKVNPGHYKNFSIETIDMMERIWGAEAVALFCEMNAFKYRMRAGTKPGEDSSVDLDKARWYEEKRRQIIKDFQEGFVPEGETKYNMSFRGGQVIMT